MTDYKWQRLNNAGVYRSDHFVTNFVEEGDTLPLRDEFLAMIKFKPEMERDALINFAECYKDTVGHVEISADKPGLFETFGTKKVDVVLMDNLFDIDFCLLHSKAEATGKHYALPFSLSRCENESELAQNHYYGPHLTPEESAANWVKIISYIQAVQPEARIIFFCAHSCTFRQEPDRYERARGFPGAFLPRASELGISIIPPFELAAELTRMPEDPHHYDMRVYRAMAGRISLAQMANIAPKWA